MEETLTGKKSKQVAKRLSGELMAIVQKRGQQKKAAVFSPARDALDRLFPDRQNLIFQKCGFL